MGRAAWTLDSPVTVIKGMGVQKAKACERLGIRTLEDLLYHFPFRYNWRQVLPLHEARHGETVTFRGQVSGQPLSRWYGRKRARHTVSCIVDGVPIQLVWFNQNHWVDKLRPGVVVQVSGKWDAHRLQLTCEEMALEQQLRDVQEMPLQPVYATVSPLTSKVLQKAIWEALEMLKGAIDEFIPADILQKYRLLPREEAIRNIHFPPDKEALRQARRRLAYEEVLVYQFGLQLRRKQLHETYQRPPRSVPRASVEQFMERLPFQLTDDQRKAVADILADLERPQPMNRLLLGDVGSGKTVVAAIAMLAMVKAGYQCALMVPTEILAEQHGQTLQHLYRDEPISVAVLTGSTPARRRQELLAQLRMGLLDVLVGTHTLIQENIQFFRLGLVVTDEQHRFGVKQRESLRTKGEYPDALFMTATPIPRTLAITMYGDMDLSVIRQMPSGRKPVRTIWIRPRQFPQVVAWIQRQVDAGYQAYVICPLIEESAKMDVQNAVDLHARLSQQLKARVGLLHGRMASREKEHVMEAFHRGEIDVLVSTSVVEVGVDVPRATVMVIYDAERFGLAQLHQLRGRVGRGDAQSYCFLVADPKTPIGRERMKTVVEMHDGFAIAEQDLRLRGPGDVLGFRQSGEIDFRLVDLAHDHRMVECARQDARQIVEHPDFAGAEHNPLYRQLVRRGYGEVAPFD